MHFPSSAIIHLYRVFTCIWQQFEKTHLEQNGDLYGKTRVKCTSQAVSLYTYTVFLRAFGKTDIFYRVLPFKMRFSIYRIFTRVLPYKSHNGLQNGPQNGPQNRPKIVQNTCFTGVFGLLFEKSPCFTVQNGPKKNM